MREPSRRPYRAQARTQAKAAASAPPARAGLSARQLAVRLVSAVIEDRQPLDQAWSRATRTAQFIALDTRDRAFARSLAATTLRRQGELELALAAFLEKPLPADKGHLWSILLIGATQLLCLGMPPHAVVDLSVELARHDRGARRFAKLTNAVLRRVSEKGAAILENEDRVRLNIPGWLLERWEANYGPEVARRICEASLREAPVDISLKAATADAAAAQAWADRLGGRVLSTGSVRLIQRGGRIEELPGYGEGAWWVQDAAAALVVRAAGPVAGLAVADLCAAPGGKTASLADAGASVTAVDVSQPRLARLEDNLKRLALAADVVCADIAQWVPGRSFDVVLLDAPCSATGTIRRHPDLLRLKRPEDIVRIGQLQSQLLARAATYVAPGGLLLYSTCSLEPEEGLAQVEAFLAAHGAFRRAPLVAAEIGAEAGWITPEGDLRTLPCHLVLEPEELSGLDGFYVARMRRCD